MKVKSVHQKNQCFLTVKLGHKEQFNVAELELLSTRAVPGLLCPVSVKGKQYNLLTFDVSLYTTLDFYLTCLQSPIQFIELAQQCIQIFKKMRELYMKPENLISSLNQIYIMLQDRQVEFIFLPLMNYTGNFSLEFFFRQLAEKSVCGTYDFVLFREQYLQFLSRPSQFSLREFEAFLCAIQTSITGEGAALKQRQVSAVQQHISPYSTYHPPLQTPVTDEYVAPASFSNQEQTGRTGTVVFGATGGATSLQPDEKKTMPLTAQVPPVGWIILEKGNRKICLQGQEVRIGSSSEKSDFVVENPTVSRLHAKVSCRNGRFYLQDCNSMNGTYCNGKFLGKGGETELQNGDTIYLSNEKLIFQIEKRGNRQ